MSLALLFPLGLAALAAWALPLLLHLARREQRTLTPFAALRWLAVREKPRQRLRFDEILLLVLRLALLAALALLLARPALTGCDAGEAWEVVHPALAAPAVGADDGVQRRWLAPGFPSLDQPRPAAAVATSSLLRQLDADLPAGATLTVRVPAVFDGADGERPRLSRRIRWQVAEDTRPATPDLAAAATARPRLVIRHDQAHATQALWLRAAAIAWQAAAAPPGADIADAEAIDSAVLATPLPEGGFVLAWLASGDLPAPVRTWIEAGGTALLAVDTTWPLEAEGAVIPGAERAAGTRGGRGTGIAVAAALGRGRVVQLRQPLLPAAWPALLEADFPRTLRTLVLPPAPAPARAEAAMHAPREGGPGFEAAPRELQGALVWLVLALFAIERMVATGRRPEAGA